LFPVGHKESITIPMGARRIRAFLHRRAHR